MDFIGGNTDFRTEAVFKAVGKTGGGIDHHAGRIHAAQKLLRTGIIGGDDAVGVVAAVTTPWFCALATTSLKSLLYLSPYK